MYGSPRSGLPNPLQQASVSDSDYQEFHDEHDTFELRVFPGTSLTQGRSFVMWDDILDAFPKVSRLQCGKRIVGFMADADGNR
ncbi:hypothetical protein BGZ58_004528 [Dissophora ornata]|nr:hypothetical protein BGZ58_004528 [Dissophora ornata]